MKNTSFWQIFVLLVASRFLPRQRLPPTRARSFAYYRRYTTTAGYDLKMAVVNEIETKLGNMGPMMIEMSGVLGNSKRLVIKQEVNYMEAFTFGCYEVRENFIAFFPVKADKDWTTLRRSCRLKTNTPSLMAMLRMELWTRFWLHPQRVLALKGCVVPHSTRS